MTDDEQSNESEDELRRRAKKLFNTGVEAFRRGGYSEALSSFESALSLYRGLPGSERNQANCLFNSGIMLGESGDLHWSTSLRFIEVSVLFIFPA